MTYKERVLRFLKAKDRYIKSATGLNYVLKEDLKEVEETWTPKECKFIYQNLSNISSARNCPWCLRQVFKHNKCIMPMSIRLKCTGCEYGKRNGVCNDYSSRNTNRYDRIIDRLPNGTFVCELINKNGEKAMKLCIDGVELKVGEEVTTFRGDKGTLTGSCRPHKPSSTGRVYVDFYDGTSGEFFPSIIGAKWEDREDR